MKLALAGFIACSLVIFFCGSRLAKYGEFLGEKTGLGKTWIGTFLVASVTSLPEFFTGVSSLLLVDVPDMAIGNVLGACAYNLLLISLLDSLIKEVPLSSGISLSHLISISLSTLMLTIIALSLYLAKIKGLSALGWVSPSSIIVFFLYFVGIRLVYLYEQRNFKSSLGVVEPEVTEELTVKRALYLYFINAFGCIFASLALPKFGVIMAKATGLTNTFVGTFLLSLSTTMPEIVVSVFAVKNGAPDLALGSIFGSVLFNLFILAFDDFIYFKGPLVYYSDFGHLISIFTLIAMQSVFVLGMVYRSDKKPFIMAWDALFIMIIFVIYLMILYG